MIELNKCNKRECCLFTWLSPTHCGLGFQMIELCKTQRKNTKKNVSKSNNRRPDTKGTDAV